MLQLELRQIKQFRVSFISSQWPIYRIRAHLLRTDDDYNDYWSIEKLESALTGLIDQNIIESNGDTYKIKQTQGHTLTDNTQVESIIMMVPETQNTTHITYFTIPETQKSPELISAIFEETQKTLTYHWKYHIPLKDPLSLLKRILRIILLLSRIFS